MPERARVFHAEYHKKVREAVLDALLETGHTLESSASRFGKALCEIDHLKERGINVAILGDSLSPRDQLGYQVRAMIEAIHRKAPGVKIIEYSTRDMGADIHLNNPSDLQKLGEEINKL